MIDLKSLWQNGMLYGGDYNPDQWRFRKGTLEEDIKLMKEAHINVVSMGMFSWQALEPQEGEFDFSWLDEAIDKLYDNGICTMLSTPSGARPAWLATKYPQVLRTNEYQIKQRFGERHNHCFSSPIYQEKVRIINEKLAQRYKDHPGVILWHISNEYEGECHCDLCQVSFRNWLKNKYNNNLDALNKAWWTGFWGHTFTDWDQIISPTPIGDWSLDGLNLDWRRFVTDQTLEFYKKEVETVRKITPNRPVTTNFHDFTNIGKGLNYWKFAPYIDIIAWDNYPYWHNETHSDAIEGARRAFIHDINRSFKQKPFLMLESCPGATNWQTVSRLPKPGVVALQGMQAIAHGSDSVQYFQIRKSLGASEKYHASVIDHYPTNKTRLFKEVSKIGQDLKKLNEVIGSHIDARIALIYDWENKWALDNVQGLNEKRHQYFELLINHYYPLWSKGLSVDVIDMNQDISKYDIVIAPMLYVVGRDLASRIDCFVKEGGIFITGPFSGIVDENQINYMNGRPGPLKEMAGIWVEDVDALYPSQTNGLVKEDEKVRFEANGFCDLINLEGAKALYRYESDFYQGQAAITKNTYGKGEVYYFGTLSNQDFYNHFYQELLSEKMSDKLYDLEEGLTLNTRIKDHNKYIFISNFSATDKNLETTHDYYDLLSETEVKKDTKIILKPYSYKVFKQIG